VRAVYSVELAELFSSSADVWYREQQQQCGAVQRSRAADLQACDGVVEERPELWSGNARGSLSTRTSPAHQADAGRV